MTVVIPTFERQRWLGTAIESVLAQSFGDLEVIVSDNASADATASVVGRFSDRRLHYARLDSHVDLNTHFSLWLRQVESKYVFLLPDDDVMYPALLETEVAVLEAHPRAGGVHAEADLIDADGRIVYHGHNMAGLSHDTIETGDEYVRRAMPSGYRVNGSTALFRTEAVRTLKYEHADFPATDFGLWLRLAADWDIAFVARPLAGYRQHSASYTATNADVRERDYVQGPAMIQSIRDVKLRFLDTYGNRYTNTRRLRREARLAMRRQLVVRAGILTHPQRRLGRTVSLLAQGLRRDPLLALDRTAWRLVGGSVLGPRLVGWLRRRRPRRATEAVA